MLRDVIPWLIVWVCVLSLSLPRVPKSSNKRHIRLLQHFPEFVYKFWFTHLLITNCDLLSNICFKKLL